MTMDVKKFDSLSKRDFENGAVKDEIRTALNELAALRSENDKLRAINGELVGTVEHAIITVSDYSGRYGWAKELIFRLESDIAKEDL